MHSVCFPKGAHGNFLVRTLCIASGLVEPFNPWEGVIGAHSQGRLASKYFTWTHNLLDEFSHCDIRITCNNPHNHWRALWWCTLAHDPRLSFNMLCSEEKLFTIYQQFKRLGMSSPLPPNDWQDAKTSLDFAYDGQIADYEHIKNLTSRFDFDHDWFFDWDMFNEGFIKCLEILNLDYQREIEYLWKEFIKKLQPILDCEQGLIDCPYMHLIERKRNA